MRARFANIGRIDALVESLLHEARIPGAGLALVMDGKVALAKGYGYRNLGALLPMTAQTRYPIASTTKTMNATLIDMLVSRGQLSWDEPVRTYLPRFRLQDPLASGQVSLRDLVTMRTGLGRHDFVWLENPLDRAELVGRLAHLEFSGGFRERFQYNNLTPVTAGHVAEVVAGEGWETLVRQNILEPLGMTCTTTVPPADGDMTLCYCENDRREVVLGWRCGSQTMAPAGGALHSTVEDMARWVLHNLEAESVARLHVPQVPGGHDPAAPSTSAHYALGWWIDRYNGRGRLSHTGYLPGLSTSVMLFPDERIGLVSFVNFGPGRLARLLNQHVFDLLWDLQPEQTLEEKLAQYERAVAKNRERIAATARIAGTSPSHDLASFHGIYGHPGYGTIEIAARSGSLVFCRNRLALPLEHWHYNVWAFTPNDLTEIHQSHPFERGNRLLFESNAPGRIDAVSIRLEADLAPVRFEKR